MELQSELQTAFEEYLQAAPETKGAARAVYLKKLHKFAAWTARSRNI